MKLRRSSDRLKLLILSLLTIVVLQFVLYVILDSSNIEGRAYRITFFGFFVVQFILLFPWDLFRKPMSEEDRKKYHRIM